MERGSILGYDLNEKYCQISYYNEAKEEPETLEVSSDNYQIPLSLGKMDGQWVYGLEAECLKAVDESLFVEDLFTKAFYRRKVAVGKKTYDAVWLLAKFIRLTLERFEEIDYLTFTTPFTSVDMSKMLKSIGKHLGIPKDRVYVQDYKESFCQYMFYQPKELWQYESALIFCDATKIKAYMLRRLNVVNNREKELFVTVDEVAKAHIKELEAIHLLMDDEEKARNADESFKAFIQSVFEKKVISSVYLTGEGFENNWYPKSLKVLCNGRRAFVGNNLYSKGACYTSVRICRDDNDGPIYLDETKMTQRISLRMRVNGKEGWYPIVSWGTRWYEADGEWEVLLEDDSDLEVHIESLAGEELQVEKISMKGLPERTDYSLRLKIEIMFLEERLCRLTLRDIGFGDFYPATGFCVTKDIHLGGINGQFNSMS